MRHAERRRAARAAPAALVFGAAAGGLLDVIVLHQILQWHHLLSGRRSADSVAGLEWNLRWDGVFELGALIALVLAAGVLWRERDRAQDLAVGWLALAGWGLFNLFDEFLFHLVLGAHHIRGDSRGSPADWLFFGGGAALFVLGVYGASRSRPRRHVGQG